MLAPTGVGVVARLIRQHRLIVVAEIHLAIVVRAVPFPIHVREPIAVRSGRSRPPTGFPSPLVSSAHPSRRPTRLTGPRVSPAHRPEQHSPYGDGSW